MKMQRMVSASILIAFFATLVACGATPESTAQMDALTSQISQKESELTTVKKQLSEKEDAILDLESQVSSLEGEVKELDAKVKEAAPWFEKTEQERKAEQEKIAAEKAAKEAAEKAAKEAEEKVGYNTGITYAQLARTPDDYKGKKVKFKGEVLQVMEGDGEVELRVAVDEDYNDVIYMTYDSKLVKSRVLEEDVITAYGVSQGLFTYSSTGSGEITIPQISVDKIEQ